MLTAVPGVTLLGGCATAKLRITRPVVPIPARPTTTQQHPLAPVTGRRSVPDSELVNAAGSADVNRVKALLARGASPNARGTGNQPALIAAIAEPMYDTGGGVCDTVRVLLQAGADPNATDCNGATALMTLCCTSMDEGPKVARMLLARGANPNVRDRKGRTALMAAAQSDAPDLCHILLEAGADPATTDQVGKSALDYAHASGEKAAVPVLSRAETPHLRTEAR